MEQAFNLINGLLDRDERSRARGLRIRTYKVIPLGATAGLLEFVDQTRPFSEVLVEAYKKYASFLQNKAHLLTAFRMVQVLP